MTTPAIRRTSHRCKNIPNKIRRHSHDTTRSYPIRAGRDMDLFLNDDLQLDIACLQPYSRIFQWPVAYKNPTAAGGHCPRLPAHNLFQRFGKRTEQGFWLLKLLEIASEFLRINLFFQVCDSIKCQSPKASQSLRWIIESMFNSPLVRILGKGKKQQAGAKVILRPFRRLKNEK